MFTGRGPDDRFPDLIDGRPLRYGWPLATLVYCSEGFIAAHTHLGNPELQNHIAEQIKPSVEWLLKTQNSDGYWGKLRSSDGQRSPCVASVLSWYYHTVDADPRVAKAVEKYCRFLLDPENSKKYGVKELVRTTGFVGLTVAEIVEPGITFK